MRRKHPDSFLINYRQNLAEDSTYAVKDTLFGSMPGLPYGKRHGKPELHRSTWSY
ncbi:MAG: hypothetical protein IPN76_19715 [Saprospiraceae bacterium]|nr:hypothetical protein [Saprospiraceae bacterium]